VIAQAFSGLPIHRANHFATPKLATGLTDPTGRDIKFLTATTIVGPQVVAKELIGHGVADPLATKGVAGVGRTRLSEGRRIRPTQRNAGSIGVVVPGIRDSRVCGARV
jgi:hypothetical protein